jgi:hypothetical protein
MDIPSLYFPSLRNQPLRDASGQPEAPSSRVHSTNNLKRLLQILLGIPKPHILDLGRLSGPNIGWLVQRGFKVYVDDRITALKPAPVPVSLAHQKKTEKKLPPPPPFEPLDYGSDFFHAILCWDLFDYIVLKQAQEVIDDSIKILKPKGLLLAFFNFDRSSSAPPTRYHIVKEDQLDYEPLPTGPFPRQIYENREIKELFSKFDTLNSCFLKNQMRELLVQKR